MLTFYHACMLQEIHKNCRVFFFIIIIILCNIHYTRCLRCWMYWSWLRSEIAFEPQRYIQKQDAVVCPQPKQHGGFRFPREGSIACSEEHRRCPNANLLVSSGTPSLRFST